VSQVSREHFVDGNQGMREPHRTGELVIIEMHLSFITHSVAYFRELSTKVVPSTFALRLN